MQIQALMFTISDAVRVSGLSRSVVYEMLKDGRLKARKAGRRTLIPASELQRYLDQLPEYQTAV